MILVDTSVWIDHYRNSNATLAELLTDAQVLSHAFVRGELACGNLKDRAQTLRLHESLPQSLRVHDDEVIAFITVRRLAGQGLGWVDAHLLASAVLTPDALLWTRDGRLARAAHELGVAFQFENGVE